MAKKNKSWTPPVEPTKTEPPVNITPAPTFNEPISTVPNIDDEGVEKIAESKTHIIYHHPIYGPIKVKKENA